MLKDLPCLCQKNIFSSSSPHRGRTQRSHSKWIYQLAGILHQECIKNKDPKSSIAMFVFPSMVKIVIAICVIFGAYRGPSLIINMAPPGLGNFIQPHGMLKLIPEDESDIDMTETSERTAVLDTLSSSSPEVIQWTSLNKVVQGEETAEDLLLHPLATPFGDLTQAPDFSNGSYFSVNKGILYGLICFIILFLIYFLFSLMNILKREPKSPHKKEILKLEPKSHVKEESEKNNMKLSVIDIDIYDSIAHNNNLISTREPLIEVSLAISEQLADIEKTSSLKKNLSEAECLPGCDYDSQCPAECQQENENEKGISVSGEVVPSDMVEQTNEIKGDQELTIGNNNDDYNDNDDDDDDDDDDDQVKETWTKPDLKSDDDVIIKVVDLPDLLPLSSSDYESIGTFDSISKKNKALRNKYKLMLTLDERKHLDDAFFFNLQHQYEGQCSLTYSINKENIYFKGKKTVVHEVSNEIRRQIYSSMQEEIATMKAIKRLHKELEGKKGEEDDERPVKMLVGYQPRGKDYLVFVFNACEMARRLIVGKWGCNKKRVYKEYSVNLQVCIDTQLVLLKGQKADVLHAYDFLKEQVENSGLF